MDLVKRLLVPLVVLAFVVAAAVTVFGGDTGKTVVAHFPRAISVYEGSDVRVLGVPVGTVTRVEPTGTDVTVTMTYDDEVKLPSETASSRSWRASTTRAAPRSTSGSASC